MKSPIKFIVCASFIFLSSCQAIKLGSDRASLRYDKSKPVPTNKALVSLEVNIINKANGSKYSGATQWVKVTSQQDSLSSKLLYLTSYTKDSNFLSYFGRSIATDLNFSKTKNELIGRQYSLVDPGQYCLQSINARLNGQESIAFKHQKIGTTEPINNTDNTCYMTFVVKGGETIEIPTISITYSMIAKDKIDVYKKEVQSNSELLLSIGTWSYFAGDGRVVRSASSPITLDSFEMEIKNDTTTNTKYNYSKIDGSNQMNSNQNYSVSQVLLSSIKKSQSIK